MKPQTLPPTQPELQLQTVHNHQSSPSSSGSTTTPTSAAQRRIAIAIAVDLSDESAFVVNWAIRNYLRSGDAVILLHSGLPPSSTAPIGASPPPPNHPLKNLIKQKMEDDFDNLTITKASHLAEPLVDANFPYKIHIVKDHDLKERLCLEVERLGLSAVIMGSLGFGAGKRSVKGRLGSVSDYCVHHYVCPVIVVRYPNDKEGSVNGTAFSGSKAVMAEEVQLHPVPEEEHEYHDDEEEEDDHDEKGSAQRPAQFD